MFVDEDRENLKDTIKLLEEKVTKSEIQKEDGNKNEVIKDCKIADLERKIKDLESELQKNEEDMKEIDDLKKENAILNSAKNADDEKMKWLADERDHDRENFDSFIKKVLVEKLYSNNGKIE